MATQHHPDCPNPPLRRCGVRAVPEPHEPKHFARSRRDILIGAGAGMLLCVGIRRWSRAKFPEYKYLELRPEPPELDHFPGFGAGAGTVGILNSEPEPECFPGTGARAVQNYPGTASQILAMRYHPCGLESSWPLGALVAAERPPNQSVHLGLLAQSVRHRENTRSIERSLNGSQAVTYRAYEHSGYARSLGFAALIQSPKKCHYMKCRRNQEDDVQQE